MIGATIFFVMAALILGYGALLYKGLVRVRAEVKLTWSDFAAVLVQRHDALPKLLEVCRPYLQRDEETAGRVLRARSDLEAARRAHDVAAVSVAEGSLRGALAQLYALAERDPHLKTDQTFRRLRSHIGALEAALAERHEIYNGAVNAQNMRIEIFPDALIAGLCHFEPARRLKFTAADAAEAILGLAFGK